MTFRARPTTRTGRRGSHESDARRNLYYTIGFGAVVLVAILLLAGAAGASWYGDHLQPVARVNGETITKDDLRDRAAVEAFRLETLASRTREKVTAGHMSDAQGQQLLSYIQQQQSSLDSLAYSRAVDTTLILQLAAKRNVAITSAAVDAQVTDDATVVESRHIYLITVKPEVSSGATTSTQAQKDAAKKKADGLLTDLNAGKSWEDVVKESGDADAATSNGDLLYVDKGTTSPDKALMDAVFALTANGYTAVVEGSDGAYRIGRLTDIAAAVVDPNYMKRAIDAGVSDAAYRKAASAFVARDGIQAQLLGEVVDKASEQRRIAELVLEDNAGGDILPGAVLVKHILYAPKDDAANASKLAADDPAWAAAKGEADKAYADLKAGTVRFVDLVQKSDDTGSAAANGFLPYSAQTDTSSSLDPAFAAAIYQPGLQPGQLLPPVKTAFGWHVIEFVTADTPTVRAEKLVAEASKPGADFAKMVAESSIAASAKNGGEVGWIARYQLDKAQEDVVFATQANAVSTGFENGGGLDFVKVEEVATRSPDATQAQTLKDNAFNNWYTGIRNDANQAKVEDLRGG